MKKVFLFLADGFEDIEAIAPIDIFRRAGIDVTTVSVKTTLQVTSAHGVTVLADKLFADIQLSGNDLLFLPGGLPGTTNLNAHAGLKELLLDQSAAKGEIAAICAAPSILGGLGLLKGKEAICYPGFEELLTGAEVSTQKIVKADTVYTAKAAGVAIPFALKIVEDLKGKDVADSIRNGFFID